jgi:hypothetical protein
MGGAAQDGGSAGPDRAEALLRLASRSRELIDDLDGSRPELLSPPDLNRALKQILRNEVAILEFLSSVAAPGEGLQSRPTPRPTSTPPATGAAPPGGPARNGLAPQARPGGRSSIAIRPRPPAERPSPYKATKQDESAEELEEVGAWSRPDDPVPPVETARANGTAPQNGAAHAHEPEPAAPSFPTSAEPAAAEAAPDSASPAAAEAPAVSLAESLLQETKTLPGSLARVVVELFDNRDKDYAKGLDKLNRWVSGGAGTPFQWRGERAYLNLNGAGKAAVKNYEEQLMTRMGFSKRLGRLVVPGLLGEIVVYERPPG